MGFREKRLIKNINGKAVIDTNFRGKRFILKPKHTLLIHMDDEEEVALMHYILETYKFVLDVTSNYLEN